MATLSFRRGNTWTPSITVTAPFALESFTATAGLYEKAERLQTASATLTTTVTSSTSGGTVDLVLAATDSDTLEPRDYYLAIQLNRASDDYTYELDPVQVTVTGDIISA